MKIKNRSKSQDEKYSIQYAMSQILNVSPELPAFESDLGNKINVMNLLLRVAPERTGT